MLCSICCWKTSPPRQQRLQETALQTRPAGGYCSGLDVQQLSQHLFNRGAAKDVRVRNRNVLYRVQPRSGKAWLVRSAGWGMLLLLLLSRSLGSSSGDGRQQPADQSKQQGRARCEWQGQREGGKPQEAQAGAAGGRRSSSRRSSRLSSSKMTSCTAKRRRRKSRRR